MSRAAGEVGIHDAKGNSEGLNGMKLTLDGEESEEVEDRAECSWVIINKQDCVQFCLCRETNCQMMSGGRVVDEPASSVSREREMEREGEDLSGDTIIDKADDKGVDKATCSNFWCCKY